MDERHVPGIDRKTLEKPLTEDFQRCMAEVIDTARIGAIIDDGKEPVRMATSRLRQAIFQEAVQMKTAAAEAAFLPSAEVGKIETASQGMPSCLSRHRQRRHSHRTQLLMV